MTNVLPVTYAYIYMRTREEGSKRRRERESYEQLRVNASSFIFDAEFIETSYSRDIITIKKTKEIKRVA